MNKNFLTKIGAILAILIVFLYGIFGIPKSFSGDGLRTAVTDHIHLGLDLRGGTHLVLQVRVNDAVNVDAQNAIEVLKDQLHTKKIDYTDISQADPPIPGHPQSTPDRIVIKGAKPPSRPDFCSMLTHD